MPEETKRPWLIPKSPGVIFLAITVAVAIFYGGVYVGNQFSPGSSVLPALSDADSSPTVPEGVDFGMFWQVWHKIESSALHQPVDQKKLFYGSLSGLAESLDDPYSVFFDPETAKAFDSELSGTFFGIGAELGEKDDYLVIIAPLADSPAEKAGVRAGDKILAIDQQATDGVSVSEAVLKIRGEKGTTVKLLLLHDGETEPVEVSIIRDEIVMKSVVWELRKDGIMVIEIRMFNDDTGKLFRQAAQEALSKNATGLVIDLRNDPGGLLSEAISVASFWIDGEPIVIERDRDGDRPLSASGTARLAGLPTAVLVNGGSASASEILAGALQDYKEATVIGETTFGKGSVQEYYQFPDGSALKITVAEWLTPLQRSINKIGIKPDIEVGYTLEDYHAGRTPQLDAAIDYLKSQR